MLHRDIKPPNLILDSLGNVWVTDFGLAKFEEGEDLSRSQVIGTLRYMAPERFKGVSDRRGDIYALGATLYELLTLRPAFDGKDQLQLIRRIETEEPEPLRKIEKRIPADLETIVLKALAKTPADRFDTAAEMATELRRFVENRPIKSRPIPTYQHVWRWCKREPGLAAVSIAAAAMTIVLAIGAGFYALKMRQVNQQVAGNLARISESERETQMQLFRALGDQARYQRMSRRAGQRFKAMEAIQQAVEIGRELGLSPDNFDRLRDEAIASMAHPGYRAGGPGHSRSPGIGG